MDTEDVVAATVVSSKLDRIIELLEGLQPKQRKPKEEQTPSPGAKTVVDFLNSLAGTKYKHVYRAELEARIAEYGAEAVQAVIIDRHREWCGDPVMRKYLRPETLFNRKKFEGYYNGLDDVRTTIVATTPREPARDGTYEAEQAWRKWQAKYGALKGG